MKRLLGFLLAGLLLASSGHAQVLTGASTPSPQTGTGSWVRATNPTFPSNINVTSQVVAATVAASSNISVSAGAGYSFVSRSQIYSGNDGYIDLYNNGLSSFTALRFGGTTSSFPALKRNGTEINLRLADDSADAPLSVSFIRTVPVTVATLPSAATAGAGARAFVTDGSTTVILGLGLTVAGGGSNKVPVYSDGTNWIVG